MKAIFILSIFLLTGCYIYGQTNFNELKIVECDGKYGLADRMGKTLLPAKYESITELVPGLVTVKINGKYALASYEQGVELTPAAYDKITDITSDLLLVEIQDLAGLIDYAGKEIIPVKYDKIESTLSDKIIVQKNKKKGLFNARGRQLTRIEYNDITTHSSICFRTEKGNRYGLIGLDGTVLVPAKYDWELRTYDNHSDRTVFLGKRKGKYHLYNESGKWINHEWYSDVRIFSDFNYLIVEKQGKGCTKTGLIHISGRTIVPVKYAGIGHEFSAGQVSAQLHNSHETGEIHYYNKEGKRIFRDSPIHDIVYDSLHSNKHSSYTLAYKNGSISLLNSDGKVIDDGFKAAFFMGNCYQVIDRYNCMYFINEYGEKRLTVTLPIKYNWQDTFDPLPDMLILTKNKEWRSVACRVKCRRITDIKEKEDLRKEWVNNPLELLATIDRYGLDELHYTRYSHPDIRFDYRFEILEIPDEYRDLQFTNGTQDYHLWGVQFPGDWIIARKDGKYGIIDIRNITTPVLPFVYDSIRIYKQHAPPTLLLEQKWLKCYYPMSSKPRYEILNPFIYHFARFRLSNKRFGWLGLDGKEYLD